MNAFSSGWKEQDTYPHVVKIDGWAVDESQGWPRDSFYERHGLPWGLICLATPGLSSCFSLSGWCCYSSLWHLLGFPSGSAGKESACNAGDLGWIRGLYPWVGKIPWRRERLPTPVFWPGEFHGLYSPRVHKELDMTEWLSRYWEDEFMSWNIE